MNQASRLSCIQPSDLPAPPQSALSILRACSQEDVDNVKLTAFAQTDPILTTEILRIVNSPLFTKTRKIESIQHAITLLGIRALRNIVLCLMVRDALDNDVMKHYDLTAYWEDSIRHAVIAQAIGKNIGCDADECFTAGLLQEFGLLILFYLNPEQAEQYKELRELDPEMRLQQENVLFSMTHDQVIKIVMQQWALPEDLVNAIVEHHKEDKHVSKNKLSHILHCSDWFSAVFSAKEKSKIITTAYDKAQNYLNLDTKVCEKVLEEIPDLVQQTATALGLHVHKQDDFEQVLKHANASLARENMSYQELTWELENTIVERDRLATELNNEISLAQEIQKKFMPESDSGSPIVGLNIPARNLSGDFYDYVELADGRFVFALGDVSGKGVHAGILMAKTVSLFHCLAKHIQDIPRLLSIMNNEICETATRGYFVTVICGIFDPSMHSISLVNAGHMPVIYVDKKNQIKRYEAHATPLGILAESEFTQVEQISAEGGQVYLYSDGVTEATDTDGIVLEEQGLIKMIQENRNLSIAETIKNIAKCVSNMPDRPDDITLMAIKG